MYSNPRQERLKRKAALDRSYRIFFTVLATIIALAIIGLVGAEDRKTELLEQASITCQNQTNYTTPTLDQCIANQLEQNGDK